MLRLYQGKATLVRVGDEKSPVSELQLTPNPDIEKVDVAAHEDLERFF
jgi:hypothetical protein